MSSTILMVIVLVVMWLVVLVPMFVHRHEDEFEIRPTEEPSETARVLSRRSAVATEHAEPVAAPVAAAAAADPPSTPAPPRTPGTATRGASAPPGDRRHLLDQRLHRPTRARMLVRRRRTLISLVVLVATDLAGAVLLSPWLWLAVAPAALLLIGFVGWLRVQARREHHAYQSGAATVGVGRATAPDADRRDPIRRSSADRSAQSSRTTRHHSAGSAGSSRQEPVAPRGPATDWNGHPLAVQVSARGTGSAAAGGVPSAVPLDDDDLSFVEVERRAGRPSTRRQDGPYANVRHLDRSERRRAANE